MVTVYTVGITIVAKVKVVWVTVYAVGIPVAIVTVARVVAAAFFNGVYLVKVVARVRVVAGVRVVARVRVVAWVMVVAIVTTSGLDDLPSYVSHVSRPVII